MTRIALILFPGTNNERETYHACISSGMDAEIIRWNTDKDLSTFDGYVLPGGWSYEDRIRAGVIASKAGIMKEVRKQAEVGKPVIGICNGAQILIETGMIPGLKAGHVEMALARNLFGYRCTWIKLKNVASVSRCAFTKSIEKGDILPMPISHGEGRFATKNEKIIDKLNDNEQIIFKYAGDNGHIAKGFPHNPNGSIDSIAAICNKEGNVLAIMPHPERASWNRQIPGFERKSQHEMNAQAPARKVFLSMKEYIEEVG